MENPVFDKLLQEGPIWPLQCHVVTENEHKIFQLYLVYYPLSFHSGPWWLLFMEFWCGLYSMDFLEEIVKYGPVTLLYYL